jgi:N-acetylglucosamine-6-phosphate deacetylase
MFEDSQGEASAFSGETFLIRGGQAVLADQILSDACIVVHQGRIAWIGSLKSFDADSQQILQAATEKRFEQPLPCIDARIHYLAPGYIDLHVHGGWGADFMDGHPAAIQRACAGHLQHGTTTIFPTTTTGSHEQIRRMIAACQHYRDASAARPRAQLEGIHLYGPYFARDKAGCHLVEGCRLPVRDEFDSYFESNLIKIATCAAELPGAAHFYRAARAADCLITCGHSNAAWPELEAAFQLGLRHVDHFWCAMSNVSSVRARLGTPMRGSMLEFVLAQSEMSTEVIADGQHLAPELLRFAWQMKGAERLCLVTDCNRALDMPEGRYQFGATEDLDWFDSDGLVGRTADGNLASSIMGMDQMVQQMHRATGIPLEQVIRMASLTPAERTGIDRETGSIAVGKRADLLLLDQDLQIQQIFVRGQRVERQQRD